jgi:abortive infection bacteriophage resistance protein
VIYDKNHLTLEKQADRLIERGLTADRQELISRLRVVNYYRLTGYLHPFRVRDAEGNPTEQFVAGACLNTVWRRYNFDRRLRILLMDAIERIEVAVRTQLVYHFVHASGPSGDLHGPFGYLNAKNLPGFRKQPWWRRALRNTKSLLKLRGFERSDHAQWLAKLQNEKSRASDAFVKHFKNKYGDCHEYLPLWMACELMTCETTLQLANGVDRQVLKTVAAEFGFPDEQLLSWIKAIFALRNSCAHHARIWNRVFGVKPSVPGKNKNPQWHTTPGFAPDRVGLLMTVCHFWLGKVSPTTHWKDRLFLLFDEYPEIPVVEMGLPPDWRNHTLWR